MRALVDPHQWQRRSRHIRTVGLLVGSARRRFRNGRGYIGNDGGRRHSGKLSIGQSIEYVEKQFVDYLATIRSLRPLTSLAGWRVLEVGPGDTNAVAAMFVAAGASEVIAIDRFQPDRDLANDVALSTAVVEGFDAGRYELEAGPSITVDQVLDRVSYRPSLPLELAAEDPAMGRFDLILSNAVLEHVFDLEACFGAMDGLLAPEGVLAHLVDLRDHGLYSTYGHHPLTHLTLPRPLYTAISRPSGAPNRAMAPTYVSLLERAGYDYTLRTTHLLFDDPSSATDVKRYRPELSGESLAEIRPRLAKEFTAVDDPSLNAAGIAFAARRRSQT